MTDPRTRLPAQVLAWILLLLCATLCCAKASSFLSADGLPAVLEVAAFTCELVVAALVCFAKFSAAGALAMVVFGAASLHAILFSGSCNCAGNLIHMDAQHRVWVGGVSGAIGAALWLTQMPRVGEETAQAVGARHGTTTM